MKNFKNGDTAYMIYPNLEIKSFGIDYNSAFQRQCMKVGNIFKSKEDAQIKVNIIKLILGDKK